MSAIRIVQAGLNKTLFFRKDRVKVVRKFWARL